MTKDDYIKASEIHEKIKEFQKLRDIACRFWKRYFYKTTVFGISSYDRSEVCICDEGLTEVIRDYCDKRIQELEDELDAL